MGEGKDRWGEGEKGGVEEEGAGREAGICVITWLKEMDSNNCSHYE